MPIKTPFGIWDEREEKWIKKFDDNPKKAAKMFLEERENKGILNKELKKIYPFKNKSFSEWLSKFGIEKTKLEIERKDKEIDFLIQTVRGYQEIIEQINKIKERLEELKSTGYEDKKVIDKYKEQLKNLEEFKKNTENYIREKAKEIMPNTSDLIGPILACEFLAKIGSLKKFAKLPASTLQVLGAEKALFRYMKGKGKPPKYGLIAKSPFVINAPKNKKGKVARLLALKLSLAVKTDFFSGEYNPKIREEFLKKYRKLIEKKKP